jgi:hypothetical protein
MGHESFHAQMGVCSQLLDKSRDHGREQSEAPHTGIDVDMHGTILTATLSLTLQPYGIIVRSHGKP